MVYRPAVDWVSQVARAASSTSRAYYVASAKHVEVRLASAGDDSQTMVELEVDPGIRGDYAAGVFLGGGFAGLLTGAGVGVSVALVAPLALAVAAGVASAAGVGGAVAWAAARGHKKKLLEVRTEMEGILDRLESGDTLEPPPPSWRRWVRRHFHGVARDLMGDDDAV